MLLDPTLLGLILLLLAAAAIWGRAVADTSVAAPAKAAGATPLVALGKLVPRGDVVTLALPYGSGDARLSRLLVEEGDRVRAGDLLAELDSTPALAAARAAAAARVEAEASVLDQTRIQVRVAGAEAEASLAMARVAAAKAARDLARAMDLGRTGVSPDRTVEQHRADHDRAVQEVARWEATLSRFTAAAPEQQVDVRVAARSLEAARAALMEAEVALDRAGVRAPLDGAILRINARPGERPGADGILTLGRIDEMEVEMEVHQAYIARVRLGDPVRVEGDALAAPLHGRVIRIGLDVGRQDLVDVSPAANTDARVVRVTAALDEPSRAAARTLANLQVTAWIGPGDGP
ncbi:MAG: multidrug resistance protein MdtN [Pseudomonadota bacterium]|jgi:HlyD family secretion protein